MYGLTRTTGLTSAVRMGIPPLKRRHGPNAKIDHVAPDSCHTTKNSEKMQAIRFGATCIDYSFKVVYLVYF